MSVMDNFLKIMKLNPDDLDSDYDDYDDDDYEEDEPVKVQPKSKNKNKTKEPEVFYDEDRSRKNNSKITPITKKKSGGNSNMSVCVFKPTSFDDSREVVETFCEDRTVVLNLEGLDTEVAQRILDFTYGACYAKDGQLQMISNYIFIITPHSVDVSGDFQELLSGAVQMKR